MEGLYVIVSGEKRHTPAVFTTTDFDLKVKEVNTGQIEYLKAKSKMLFGRTPTIYGGQVYHIVHNHRRASEMRLVYDDIDDMYQKKYKENSPNLIRNHISLGQLILGIAFIIGFFFLFIVISAIILK